MLQNEIAALRDKLEQQAASLVTVPAEVNESADALAREEYEARLQQKEEAMRIAKEECDAVWRRLRGLEKLILRGGPDQPVPAVRQSWAPQSMQKPEVSSPRP